MCTCLTATAAGKSSEREAVESAAEGRKQQKYWQQEAPVDSARQHVVQQVPPVEQLTPLSITTTTQQSGSSQTEVLLQHSAQGQALMGFSGSPCPSLGMETKPVGSSSVAPAGSVCGLPPPQHHMVPQQQQLESSWRAGPEGEICTAAQRYVRCMQGHTQTARGFLQPGL